MTVPASSASGTSNSNGSCRICLIAGISRYCPKILCTRRRSAASKVLKLGSHLTTAIAAVAAAGFAAGLCFGFGGKEDSPREQAAALISKAKKATKANHAADAYLLYSQASALEPKNSKLKG